MPKRAYGHAQPEERREADFYPTPDALALACCQAVRKLVPRPHIILEPSAGSGAFVRAAMQTWGVNVISVEIRPEAVAELEKLKAGNVYQMDFQEFLKMIPLERGTLVIGNPPYSLAQAHIMTCLDYLLPGDSIAFLLKLGFLGTKDRADALWKIGQCKYLLPILGRPSFVKGTHATSDVNEYGLFVWEAGYNGPMTVLFPHIRGKKERSSGS